MLYDRDLRHKRVNLTAAAADTYVSPYPSCFILSDMSALGHVVFI